MERIEENFQEADCLKVEIADPSAPIDEAAERSDTSREAKRVRAEEQIDADKPYYGGIDFNIGVPLVGAAEGLLVGIPAVILLSVFSPDHLSDLGPPIATLTSLVGMIHIQHIELTRQIAFERNNRSKQG